MVDVPKATAEAQFVRPGLRTGHQPKEPGRGAGGRAARAAKPRPGEPEYDEQGRLLYSSMYESFEQVFSAFAKPRAPPAAPAAPSRRPRFTLPPGVGAARPVVFVHHHAHLRRHRRRWRRPARELRSAAREHGVQGGGAGAGADVDLFLRRRIRPWHGHVHVSAGGRGRRRRRGGRGGRRGLRLVGRGVQPRALRWHGRASAEPRHRTSRLLAR